MIVVSSDYFTWTADVGVTDFTDLPPELTSAHLPSVGLPNEFDVRSVNTGLSVTFYFTGLIHDREGDMCGWSYASEGHHFHIEIIND